MLWLEDFLLFGWLLAVLLLDSGTWLDCLDTLRRAVARACTNRPREMR